MGDNALVGGFRSWAEKLTRKGGQGKGPSGQTINRKWITMDRIKVIEELSNAFRPPGFETSGEVISDIQSDLT